MASWQYTISGGGVTKKLSEIGGHSLSISRRAGAVSTASWIVDAPPENAPLWPFGTRVSIKRSGGSTTETLFQGTVTNDQPSADPSDESTPYQASDAWWDMDGEVYQQTRKISLADGSLADATYGRALLGRAANGERLTAAQIVGAAVSYAADIGIDIRPGTITAPVTPPWFEVTDKTISEIIRLALLWQPDAVPWIDHTTSPPTLHVTRRSAMEQTELDFAGLGQCRVRAFPEQQISGCEITYELSNKHGRTVSVDSAGDTSALRCARFTIPLEFEAGAAAPRQEIKTVPLGDYTQLGWWQRIFPWLPNDADITEVMIMPAPPEGFNILVAGQITDWMRDERNLSAGSYTVRCKAKFSADGHKFTEKELSRSFTLTNAETHRYIGKFKPPWIEPVPEGIANIFYTAASQMQYGGSLVIEEEECSAGRGLMGKAVNVSGARQAWETMRAAVVGVDEDFDAGTTSVTLGPARHLAPQDMIDLLRASRWRHRVTPQNPDDGGQGNLDDASTDPFAPEDASSDSPGKLSALTLETEDATCAAIIDADDLEDDNPAMFREIEYTGADGKTTRAIFLATEPQADEEDPDGDGSGSSDDCSHDGPPDGGGGGGGGQQENEHDGGHPGDSGTGGDGGHPGKSGPCW